MDKIYTYGLSELFLIIVLEVIRRYKISTKYSHACFNLTPFAWRI